ncbi:hypothetical protein E8E14_003759 [Neopestalotiopsis sp. 37M]|nr:hypothetical protein E8E14_003759 [Neopestalotiopsis sp. 37M]
MSSPAQNRSQARPVEEGEGSTRAVRGSPGPLSSNGDDENNSSTTALPASQNNKDNLFLGLTPPPWPSDLIPNKKRPRSFEEILSDEDPATQDKLSTELDEMVNAHGDSKKRKVDLAHRARQDGAGPSSRPDDREGRSEK